MQSACDVNRGGGSMVEYIKKLVVKFRLKRLFFKGKVRKWKQKNTEK